MRRHTDITILEYFSRSEKREREERQEGLKYDEAEDVGPCGLRHSKFARYPRLHVQGNHELHQVAIR